MDDGAFGRAIGAERLFLLKWVRRQFKLSTADAEDFVQTSLLKAWEHRDTYEDQRKIRAWLLMILAHTVLSDKRRAWRIQFYDPQPNDEGQHLFERGGSGGQEETLYLKQVLTQMTKLPLDQLDAIIFLARGEHYGEAGEMMQVAEGTIKSRVARGRRTLREMVE